MGLLCSPSHHRPDCVRHHVLSFFIRSGRATRGVAMAAIFKSSSSDSLGRGDIFEAVFFPLTPWR